MVLEETTTAKKKRKRNRKKNKNKQPTDQLPPDQDYVPLRQKTFLG